MKALFNPSPLVLSTLQDLSMVLERSTTFARGAGVAGLSVGRSEARAFGGLSMPMGRGGQAVPAKVRYGAITITPRAQGSSFSRSPGVHPAIDRAYDNPGVRFGDKVKGGSRPTASSGETSCHFSQTSVSKTSPIRELIKAARGGRRRTGSRAAAHVLYVEREGAPERIRKPGERLQGETFTAEIERRGLSRSAVDQQAYIERAGAAEGIERKPGRPITDEELDTLDEASFGTIGNTVEERTRFWLAVEEAEASPKGDRVTIKPRDNPEWWARAAQAIDQAPISAQKPIRDALARKDDESFAVKLPTDKAFALHQWAVGLDTEAPLEISPGRGGRTQTRVIAELPHELDGRERLLIVRDFTQKLADKGFPYWAVIHAPDANNDARNYHVHIAYYDRPAAKVRSDKGTEVWDFEILEEVTWKNRTKHFIRTHQQNRLRETNDQDWVTELRKHWETVSNRVLEEAGVSKRYNLGTYESMGIDLEPLKHINSRTFNKERKGELTEEGPVLGRRQWDVVHDRVVKEHEERAQRRRASIVRLGAYAERLASAQPNSVPRLRQIGRLKDQGIKASFQLALLELHQDMARLVTDRVTSRPKLLLLAADKEDEKARTRSKASKTEPQKDRPIAGAALFGLEQRSEVLGFLTAIYDRALNLDRENATRATTARRNLQLVTRELRSWVSQPDRLLHKVREFEDAPFRDLDHPARAERRAEHLAAKERGLRSSIDGNAEDILSQLKSGVPPVQRDEAKVGATPSSPAAAARQEEPELAPPRYRPGRPDDQPRERDMPRPRFRPPALDPAFIVAALSGPPKQGNQGEVRPSPGATARVERGTTPPQETGSASSALARDLAQRDGSLPPRSTREQTEPPRAGTDRPVEINVSRSPTQRPETASASAAPVSHPSLSRAAEESAVPRHDADAAAAGAGTPASTAPAVHRSVQAVPENALRTPDVCASQSLRAVTDTSSAKIASTTATRTLDGPTLEAATAARRDQTAPQQQSGNASQDLQTPRAPTEDSGTPLVGTAPPTPTSPKARPPQRIPSLASVMEGREPARVRAVTSPEARRPQTSPVDGTSKAEPNAGPVEIQDVLLKGVRRPEKKKRELDRNKGWER